MRIFFLLIVVVASPLHADEITLQEAKNLSQERCLQLPAAEIVTRCPSLAGRMLQIDKQRAALVDRVDLRKGTQLCEDNGGWHCRRVVVLEYETRGTRKRDPQKFITAARLLERLATAPMVRLGEDFGALLAPALPPKTCLDSPTRGCAVQAIRLRGRSPEKSGAPSLRRRLWLVEDADGTTLSCSDAELTRCDELTAAGWTLLALTLRPSSLAPPELAPEADTPEARTDRRPGAIAEGAEAAAGAAQVWLRPKAAAALPKAPSRPELEKAAHALEAAGSSCVAAQTPVGVLFSGEGALLHLTVEGAPDQVACLTAAARKLAFPRFSGNSYELHAVVLPKTKGRARHP